VTFEKTPLIYSVLISIWGELGALFGGTKPTKTLVPMGLIGVFVGYVLVSFNGPLNDLCKPNVKPAETGISSC